MSETAPGPEPPAQEEPKRFGASARALAQRRLLAVLLALPALGGLALLPWAAGAPEAARLGLGAFLVLALGAAAILGLSHPLAKREVLLRGHALELRRGAFRRLVVFGSIRHIRTQQSPSGRLWSLRLDLEDDSVTLRDVEGLARLFAETAERRPAGVLIEAHEARVDWGEPLPWIVLILGLGAVALALAWLR